MNQQPIEELKLCECGAMPYFGIMLSKGHTNVSCPNCGKHTRSFNSIAEAIQAWNTRAEGKKEDAYLKAINDTDYEVLNNACKALQTKLTASEAANASMRGALEYYLQAGHKEARREASIIAKKALSSDAGKSMIEELKSLREENVQITRSHKVLESEFVQIEKQLTHAQERVNPLEDEVDRLKVFLKSMEYDYGKAKEKIKEMECTQTFQVSDAMQRKITKLEERVKLSHNTIDNIKPYAHLFYQIRKELDNYYYIINNDAARKEKAL